MYPYDLRSDMNRSDAIVKLVEDDKFAGELYAALCNMQWKKIENTVDGLHTELVTDDNDYWSCTWRTAGGIVADLREAHLRKINEELECYMSWYCSGNEGFVSDNVKEALGKLGWEPVEWEDDEI